MKEMTINSEKIRIRKVNKSDAKALIEFISVIGGESDFLTFGAGGFGRSVDEEEEFIESAEKKENALLIIAEADHKIVGCLNFSGGERQRTAHIGEFGVSVLKEYWGCGIGKELIEYLVDWSKETGIIRKIDLRVRTDNDRGIRLYKRLGFLEEGVISRDFYIDGKFYDSLIMGLMVD